MGIEKTELSKYWGYATALAVFTVIFNLIEGGVSVFFGIQDETISLLGFGMDSFVETISAVGIAHMVFRIRREGVRSRDKFERQALRITGWVFYALTIFLVAGAAVNIIQGKEPESAVAGVIIALISIALMGLLIYAKNIVGRKLNSPPILADARCNLVCMYMSGVLLVASASYALFSIPYVDALGALGLAWFSWSEGREALEKAGRSRIPLEAEASDE
jgi:divalent metal cation (Fe/Co/Zn/Cd) transporter